jgi:hypothetical protein
MNKKTIPEANIKIFKNGEVSIKLATPYTDAKISIASPVTHIRKLLSKYLPIIEYLNTWMFCGPIDERIPHPIAKALIITIKISIKCSNLVLLFL